MINKNVTLMYVVVKHGGALESKQGLETTHTVR